MVELTGLLTGITQDFSTGRYRVTFEIEEGLQTINALQEFKEKKLRISVKEWKKKRSLDANAYLWLLCTKIAEVIDSSKDEVYEEMLQKYGYLEKDEDGYIPITVSNKVDMNKIDGHWKFYSTNGEFSAYLKIKGTSQYDSKEMAHFLDMVVEEAKALDIPTETPNEIERMKALWGNVNG